MTLSDKSRTSAIYFCAKSDSEYNNNTTIPHLTFEMYNDLLLFLSSVR